MFYSLELVFDGAECVGTRFHVLRAWTHYRRYRGRRVPFSCFARPDAFSTVQRASGPVFIFCAPEIVFDGTEGVGSRFHVLCFRTHFRRSRVVRLESFSAVPRASGPFFMFCVPGLIFDGSEGVGFVFHVLRAQTRFRRNQGRQIPFFMFSAPGLVFDGTECVESRFLILHTRTRFRRYRGSRILFSCFMLPDSFSAVPWASGPVFTFCAPGLVFGGTEGVGSRCHVLCPRTRYHFRR
jgi:hypothetical protein